LVVEKPVWSVPELSTESKHILIAESNSSLAGLMRSKLEGAGFTVTVVEDGRDAWEQLGNREFDLVVTEYSLSDRVGTQVCRGLRQNKRYADLPLIVVATAGETDLDRLRDELQLVAALAKPLSVKRLVATVERQFSGDTGPPAPAEASPPAAEAGGPADGGDTPAEGSVASDMGNESTADTEPPSANEAPSDAAPG
jgi:CheY-like chemotaxis protein